MANILVTVAQATSISGRGGSAIAWHLSGGTILVQVTAQATFEIGACGTPERTFLTMFAK